MSFEGPNFNTEPKKAEQEPSAFLQEQIRLPEAEWSETFRKLIEEKIQENKREHIDEPEATPEMQRERTYKRYTDGLGLDESKLSGKKILDLGFGEGEFVQYLTEKGITSQAYGVDAELDEALIDDKLKPHFFKGNFEEDLPVTDVDYIVSLGAVTNGIWSGEERMNMKRIVEKSLASLKEDGEIRIYPIQEAAMATPLIGLEKSRKKWDELLAEIPESLGVECKIEPRAVRVMGDSNDIFLESALIIRKKQEKNEIS